MASSQSPNYSQRENVNQQNIKEVSTVSTKEKLQYIKNIDAGIRTISPKIISSYSYGDKDGFWYFSNSEDCILTNKLSEFTIDLSMELIYAQKRLIRSFTLSGRIHETNFNLNSALKFGKIRAQRFVDSAVVTLPPKKRLPVIMDSELSGHVIHEVIHGLDGDFALTGSPWKKKMGKKLFSKELTITDVPKSSNPKFVTHNVDAEGFPTSKTLIIKEGKLQSFFTDSFTAEKLKTENSHNARISQKNNYLFPTTSNLMVSPGNSSFEMMITETQEGIVCRGILGDVSVDWKNNIISLLPEQAIFFANGELHEDIPLSVTIKAPLDEFLRNVKVGKKAIASNIYCFKGGGIICGVSTPPLLFERLNILPKEGKK